MTPILSKVSKNENQLSVLLITTFAAYIWPTNASSKTPQYPKNTMFSISQHKVNYILITTTYVINKTVQSTDYVNVSFIVISDRTDLSAGTWQTPISVDYVHFK